MSKKFLGFLTGVAVVLAAFSFVVIPTVDADELDLETMDTAELIALIQQLLGSSSTATTTTTTTTTTTSTGSFAGIPAGFSFDTNLYSGMSSVDVEYLQIVLNSDPATVVATTGTGSAGNETEYFGSLTKAAVIKFQNKYASEVLTPLGLTSGTGYVGTTTRAKLNSLVAAGSTTTTTPTTDVSALSAVDCVTQGYAWNGTVCSDPNATVTDIASLSAVECVTQGYAWDGTTCFDPSATGSTTTPVVTPVEGAGMTVALASDSPANTTLVTGQSNAPIAKFVFTNKDSVDASITNVTLNRIGVSADSTLANVYLFNGDVRLTDSASVNEGVISFNSGGGLFTVPAGSSMTVTVSSDIATDTSGQIVGVSLTGVTSNVEVSSTLPVVGGTQTIAAASLATYTFGTMSPTTSSTTAIDPANDVVVWQTAITAGTRDIEISKLALKQISSIERSDVENFRLYINGEEIAQVDGLDENNIVTFLFNYTLTGTKTFQVQADIVGGSSRTLQMSLRNKADFTAIDSQYGVSVGPASGTSIPANAGVLSINSGIATMKKDSTSPTGYASLNASNQLIAKYDLEVYGEDIKIDTLKFQVALTNGGGSLTLPAGLRNGRVLINGTQYGSTASLLATGTEYSVNYLAQKGETISVEVYADIYGSNTASGIGFESNDTVKVIAMAGSSNATRQVSLTTTNVPGSAVNANPLTISQGSMTAVAQSNYGTQSVVFPQSDYKIAAYTVTGSAVEAANVYNLALAVTAVDANNDTQVRNVYAVIDGVQDAAIKTNATTTATSPTTVTYNFSVNKELAKNGAMDIVFYADIDTTGTPDGSANVSSTLIVSATGDESGQSITSTTGNGQTVKYSAAKLVITRAAGSPDAAILPDEGTVKTISYQIETENDAYVIDTVAVNFAGTNAGTVISQVQLKDGSNTLQTRAGGSTVTFAGLNYTIAANTKATLDVVVTLSAIGSGLGSTGADIVTTFSSAKVAPASTGVIAPYGGTAPTAGNDLYVYKTIPTISLSTLPSSTLTVGTKALSKVTVSADKSAPLSWKQLMFTLDVSAKPTIASCNTTACTGVKLYDGSTEVAGTMISDTNFTAAGAKSGATITFVPTLEQEISAGGSKTYELRATTVGGAITTDDYILTSIANPSTHANPSRLTSYNGTFTYIAAGSTVAAGDVRQSAVDNYAATGNTVTTVRTMTYVLSKFDPTDLSGTVTLSYDHTGGASEELWAITGGTSAATWTLTSGDKDGIVLTHSTGAVITGTAASSLDGDATLTVTIAKGTAFASGSAVVAGNSDLGLALTAGVDADASFIWSDESAQSHSSSTADWNNDYLVKTLPTASQSLTK
jgi:hypothetical protein